ncbi:DUF3488 and transglutaminase-like domain-containing protein [Microbacterium sp. STN6]|uniref:transglutaminase TgpA family protein n=1 Tax=Microbacterium sp. STN6 TaxID=2995588 RepID=UPI002260D160|nr:DUF3488 and transglutaminase-like domain-containing protein [Microbacterium sp. STN6]MCX7522099.1 DUF3488 and transglutaminase-like domain-containing protein [Microbacterium sp. STN6]
MSMSVSARTPPARWRLAFVQFVLVMTAMSAMTGVFAGVGWWFLAAFVAALVLFGAATLRALRLPPIGALGGALALLVVALTGVFGGGLGFAVLIPTPASVGRLLELAGRVAPAISEESIPAHEVPELLFALAAGTGVIALAVDLFTIVLGMPALAGIPILLALCVPVGFLTTGANPLWLIACTAAYLWLLAADRVPRMRRPRAARAGVTGAAVVAALALVVGVTAPGFTAVGAVPLTSRGSVLGSGVNPLIDLGQDLRRPLPVPVLSYVTSASDQLYLTLTTLDRFTGATWTHTTPQMSSLSRNDEIGAVPGLSGAVTTSTVNTTVSVDSLRSPWLPVPYPARAVSGLTGSWSYSQSDLTISSRDSSAANQNYSVTSLRVHPTPQQLQDAGGYLPPSVRGDLDLPSKIPATITRAAQKATDGATTNYEKAVALQNYFRDAGFQYSVQTPLRQGYDGDGLAVISTFLQKKSGYCVHFASAMAIMARILGIPARVAIGYLPGANAGSVGQAGYRYTVTTNELHSWPELYFPGAGWLAFEPTVGRGILPAYTVPTASDDSPVTESTPSSEATAAASPSSAANAADASSHTAAQTARADAAGWVVFALILGLALVAPAASRRMIAARGARRVQRGVNPAGAAWAEVLRTARDLRLGLSPGATARSLAATLEGSLAEPEQRAALLRLRDAVERERYARAAGSTAQEREAIAHDRDEVTRGLRGQVSQGQRVLAAALPASLLPLIPSRPAQGRFA